MRQSGAGGSLAIACLNAVTEVRGGQYQRVQVPFRVILIHCELPLC